MVSNYSFWTTILFLFTIQSYSQNCPPNIDFENGTFDNWKCYTGNTTVNNSENVITLNPTNGPIPDRHTIYSAAQGLTDYFGGFPVTSPNGSGYSVKLGNNSGGGEAEAISYEFTIPINQDNYSLTYHYAVVFQDPNHSIYQQPRLVIEALNVTRNQIIDCSSFTFFPNGSLLPGFFISPIQQDTTNVWCKNWTAVSMNLNGNAGNTIRLTFKTADCTFRKHFGYAYVDVNTECTSEFVGASFCPDDTTVSITAPFGYQSYNWYNNNFTQLLGSQQTLVYAPPPPTNSTIAVEVIPYYGYGCVDTFYAQLKNNLQINANAGVDKFVCPSSYVSLGENPKPGWVYNWSPSTGLSNPSIANPRASPGSNITYYLTVRNLGGGCLSMDSANVAVPYLDTTLILLGKEAFCITNNDSAVLFVQPTNAIQWYKDDIAINGANNIRYKVTQTGNYYARLTNSDGCSLNTASKKIQIDIPEKGILYPTVNAVEYLPITLQARPIGIQAIWSPTLFLTNANTYMPIFKSNLLQNYTITLRTNSGCITVDTQYVKVFKEIKIYVPTVFTPNSDGVNDYFKPIAAGFKEFSYFRVYNRWGVLLFDLKSNPKGWDGMYKGVPQPLQTVVWMAGGIGIDGKVRKEKGTCILIR